VGGLPTGKRRDQPGQVSIGPSRMCLSFEARPGGMWAALRSRFSHVVDVLMADRKGRGDPKFRTDVLTAIGGSLIVLATILLALAAVPAPDLADANLPTIILSWRHWELDIGVITATGGIIVSALLVFVVIRDHIRNDEVVRKRWKITDQFVEMVAFARNWDREQEGEWSFIDRPSVFKNINDEIDSHFTLQLVAEPGAGKTEILERLSEFPNSHESLKTLNDAHTLAVHFCLSDEQRSLEPVVFAKNIIVSAVSNLNKKRNKKFRHLSPGKNQMLLESASPDEAAYYLDKFVWDPLNQLDANGSKWLLVVDALDEAAEFSGHPTIVDLLQALLQKYSGSRLSKWLRVIISTRPGSVATGLEALGARSIKIDEKKAKEDVFAYIEERLHTCTFLNKADMSIIAEAAGGNFLMARYLARDFRSISAAEAPERLAKLSDYVPGALKPYYERNFGRIFDGQLPDAARRALSVMVVAAEVLSVADLILAANSDRDRISETDGDDIERYLGQLEAFCPRQKTGIRGSRGDKVKFFHRSVPDWLTDDGTKLAYRIDVNQGHRLIATWCESRFHHHRRDYENIGYFGATDADWYLLKYGINHFMEVIHLRVAVEFVDFLLKFWSDASARRDRRLKNRDLPTPRQLARQVLQGLPDRHDDRHWEQRREIDASSLINLVNNVYHIGVLAPALDILIWDNRDTWRKNVDNCARIDNYVLRFKLAETLANAYFEDDSLVGLDKILGYLRNSNINYRELGAYALGFIYAHEPREIDPTVLRELEVDTHSYAVPQVFGHILLALALDKRVRRQPHNIIHVDTSWPEAAGASGKAIIKFTRNTRFWNSKWQHLQLEIADIDAVSAYLHGEVLDTDAYRHIETTDRLRVQLVSDGRLRNFSEVSSLLGKGVYFALAKRTTLIEEGGIAEEFARMPADLRKSVATLLFSHPVWNVGETTASVLVDVYLGFGVAVRDSVKRLIQEFLDSSLDWRINLGATEAAYILAETDCELFLGNEGEGEPGSRDGAVSKFYNDPRSSRLRALCAENLITYIIERPTQIRLDLFTEFRACVDWWIHSEDDCWALEHVFRLLKTLASERVHNKDKTAYTDYVDRLFATLDSSFLVGPGLSGISDWAKLSRGDFLAWIERVKNRGEFGGGNAL
jgi:hypothetical protein